MYTTREELRRGVSYALNAIKAVSKLGVEVVKLALKMDTSIYTTQPTPRRPSSGRKAAKRARRRIRYKPDDVSYFRELKKKLSEQKRVYDWLNSGQVLTPTQECQAVCMKDWAISCECSHGVEPSEFCDQHCLSLFNRYKLCKHTVKICAFCDMPTAKGAWMCQCFDSMENDDDDAEDIDYRPAGATSQSM